jgi:hypothetical protein
MSQPRQAIVSNGTGVVKVALLNTVQSGYEAGLAWHQAMSHRETHDETLQCMKAGSVV